MKVALITGITGQDGAYLAELLLHKGYFVHGMKRRSSLFNTNRIDHLYQDPHQKNVKLELHYGDLTDSTNLIRIIQETQPDEVYNLAAMSHVHVSFETPEYTANADGLGTLRILEAVRICGLTHKTKVYQASTSELYGLVQEVPQKETTPFYPRSPYAVAKLYAYWITVNYREAYGMYACNGILFNHESPNRGETFVTRKITRAAAKIALGMQDKLFLGNLSSVRDWGHAKDFVEAMYLILQQETAEDFVIATGITKTVREFVQLTFAQYGIEIAFTGSEQNETGSVASIDQEKVKALGIDPCPLKVGDAVVAVDPRYYRPTEVELLHGDPTKAKTKLGWKPKYDLAALIEDLAAAVIFAMENTLPEPLYNVGYGSDLTIKDLALLIQKIVGHHGAIEFDSSKPNGTPRKWMDSSRLNSLGWKPKTDLENGIIITYNWFVRNIRNIKTIETY